MERLIQKLHQEYISFDVFDTLIKRSVAQPSDLFVLIEKSYVFKQIDALNGFAQKRMLAERHISEKLNRPVKLFEIYNYLYDEYGEHISELMELEIQLELNGCQPNYNYLTWFKKCIELGKTVVLISDMYLPTEIIAYMLDKCGIQGYKKLYVSCEIGVEKRDGKLFNKVLEDLDIYPRELVHIGDNWKSDFLSPISMGIYAICINNNQKQMCKKPKTIPTEEAFHYRTLQTCIRNCSSGMSEYEKLGCNYFGPQLYGFTEWLINQFQRENIHDVYFLARDGYMMKQAFEEFKLRGIKIHYLRCSRRSYQVPLIWKHSEFADVVQPFSYVEKMSIRNFLLRIGLEPDAYKDKILQCGLDLEKIYEKGSFYHDKKIIAFYDTIRIDVIANSKREYNALLAYLNSFNMDSKIAVVDVGYSGTMQYALTELIRESGWNIDVEGYYFQVNPNSYYIKSNKISVHSYLNTDSEFGKIIVNGMNLFEAQFLEPCGSVKRFVFCDNIAVPEYDTFEYGHNKAQIIDEMAVIYEYQLGAIKFIRYMINAFQQDILSFPPDILTSNISKLIFSPSLKQAEFWGDFRMFDYTQSYWAKPNSVFFYTFHPTVFFKDFLLCGWKIGFMRRLFKVPLPYDKIYMWMKNLYYHK